MAAHKFRTLMVCLPIGFSLALGAFGCSGSDDGGKSSGGGGGSGNTTTGGSLDTGLAADQSLGTLTDAQSTELCDKLKTFYSSSGVTSTLQEFSCRFAGLFAAAFSQATTDDAARSACKTSYDMCKSTPGNSTQTCNKPSGTCTATVAELEACMNDSMAALQQASNSLPSCTTLTLKDLMASGSSDPGSSDPMQSSEPASCTTLKMKCPDAPSAPSVDVTPQ